MRETQQLLPVTNGFARVTASSGELPHRALRAYKALLIELAKRDLLKKAQNAHVLLKPREGLEKEESLSSIAFLDVVRQLSSVGLEYSLDVEPPGITFTGLFESYRLTHPDDGVAAAWEANITLPSGLLEQLTLEVSHQRDWIEKNVFPITACEDTDPAWTENLTIRCVPRQG